MKNPWPLVTRFAALGFGILAVSLCLLLEVGFDVLPFYFQASAAILVFGGGIGFTAFAHSPTTVFQAFKDVFEMRPEAGPGDLERSANVFKTLGKLVRICGWLGAMLGWMVMLQTLSDLKQIGGALSLAFICVIYGYLAYAVLCIPFRQILLDRARDLRARPEADASRG